MDEFQIEYSVNEIKDEKKNIRRMSNANSLILILFMVFVFAVSFTAKPLVGIFLDKSSENYETAISLYVFIVQYVPTVPLLLILYRKIKAGKGMAGIGAAFKKPVMPKKWIVKWIIISISVAYCSSFIGSWLFSILEQIIGKELNPIDLTADPTTLGMITNILAMMFLAPFFEEILFRGTLLRSAKRYGGWSMIIITGIMFGIWHCNYDQLIYAAILGICLGFLFVKTESIIPPMLIHCIFNTIGAIMSIIAGRLDENDLSDSAAFGETMSCHAGLILIMLITEFIVFVVIIAGQILLIIELTSHRDSFIVPKVEDGISGGRKVLIYLSAPVTILMLVFYITLTVANALIV